jgi:hypothetical protein
MQTYSTREAAKKLGITGVALGRYIKTKKVMPPAHVVKAGQRTGYLWTDAEIEHVRQLLPKIANGRKTRYKKQSAASTQQSAKTKAPARVPVPQHKQRKPKKK